MKRKFLAGITLCLLYGFLTISAQQPKNSQNGYKPLDIEGAQRKEVEPYRKEYLKVFGQRQLATMLENAESYRLFVRSELKKRGMPSVLEYIPIIESDYKPSARSKDGKGVGMWQFMMNSVSPFLTVNAWIDERLDPWKSTQAALTKLQNNYSMFNDWLLAVGAYNCGAGAMQRALSKTEEKTFWAVSEKKLIPEHTIRYIPKLLAVADLAQNSAYYKITLPSANNENGSPANPRAGDFDYITVHDAIAIRLLASELRMDEQILETLNPALIYGITPPDSDYDIRLPSGMKTAAHHALQLLSNKK